MCSVSIGLLRVYVYSIGASYGNLFDYRTYRLNEVALYQKPDSPETMSAQQAHHIIPVGVFANIKENTILYEKLKSVFGKAEFHNLQQMGNNFIYLHTKQEYVDRM